MRFGVGVSTHFFRNCSDAGEADHPNGHEERMPRKVPPLIDGLQTGIVSAQHTVHYNKCKDGPVGCRRKTTLFLWSGYHDADKQRIASSSLGPSDDCQEERELLLRQACFDLEETS